MSLRARLTLILIALATVGLWFLARPYGPVRWKLAAASALVSAAVALLANQAISHLWERPRPFTAHASLTHVLGARTTDPSFPSDHAAALPNVRPGGFPRNARAPRLKRTAAPHLPPAASATRKGVAR